MFMLWQYVGIGFETNLSKHGWSILADPDNIIFMFLIFGKWIDHAFGVLGHQPETPPAAQLEELADADPAPSQRT